MNKICEDCDFVSDGPTAEEECSKCGGYLWYPL
jgi:hypothetical protein